MTESDLNRLVAMLVPKLAKKIVEEEFNNPEWMMAFAKSVVRQVYSWHGDGSPQLKLLKNG